MYFSLPREEELEEERTIQDRLLELNMIYNYQSRQGSTEMVTAAATTRDLFDDLGFAQNLEFPQDEDEEPEEIDYSTWTRITAQALETEMLQFAAPDVYYRFTDIEI